MPVRMARFTPRHKARRLDIDCELQTVALRRRFVADLLHGDRRAFQRGEAETVDFRDGAPRDALHIAVEADGAVDDGADLHFAFGPLLLDLTLFQLEVREHPIEG